MNAPLPSHTGFRIHRWELLLFIGTLLPALLASWQQRDWIAITAKVEFSHVRAESHRTEPGCVLIYHYRLHFTDHEGRERQVPRQTSEASRTCALEKADASRVGATERVYLDPKDPERVHSADLRWFGFFFAALMMLAWIWRAMDSARKRMRTVHAREAP